MRAIIIKTKLFLWVDAIEHLGIYKVRCVPGYHDEPLKGKREGQRSIRLSKGYRAIYTMDEKDKMNIISIEEVNMHDY